MSNESVDQEGLWQRFITGISQNIPGGGNSFQNIIAAGGQISCVLDSPREEEVLAQIYNIGNTIPTWSLTWNGAFNEELFYNYAQWVENINPTPPSDTTSDQIKLTEDQKKLKEIKDNIVGINKEIYNDYLEDWALNTATPLQLIDGAPTFKAYLQDKKENDPIIQQKISDIELSTTSDIAGLFNEIEELQNKIYGSNFKMLSEAKKVVEIADPLNFTASDQDSLKNMIEQLQMNIQENDAIVSVPRFVASTLEDYSNWVETQKQNAIQNSGPMYGLKSNASVKITFSHQDMEQSSSSWQFSANGGFPIDFFWLGASASGGSNTQYNEQYDFDGIITYQSITTVPISPGNWFIESLFNTYKDFRDWAPDSPFRDKILWGKNGSLNIIVKGIIVGFAPYMKITMTDWSKSETASHWQSGINFGIGPFNFESASASGKSDDVKTNTLANGIEILDTSGVPKIIGLIVETPGSENGVNR